MIALLSISLNIRRRHGMVVVDMVSGGIYSAMWCIYILDEDSGTGTEYKIQSDYTAKYHSNYLHPIAKPIVVHPPLQ